MIQFPYINYIEESIISVPHHVISGQGNVHHWSLVFTTARGVLKIFNLGIFSLIRFPVCNLVLNVAAQKLI
jgi:hypothetical protein